MKKDKLTPRSDYCPGTGEHVHSYYWWAVHKDGAWFEVPKCMRCWFDDTTRLRPKRRKIVRVSKAEEIL